MIVKRVFLALYLLSLAVALHAAEVPADAGLAEVRSLGLLNGEALACSYPEAASHIKLIIIQRAPISRRYGDAFELATKEAYLGKIREGQESCPKVAALTSRADELATRLQAVVSPEKRRSSKTMKDSPTSESFRVTCSWTQKDNPSLNRISRENSSSSPWLHFLPGHLSDHFGGNDDHHGQAGRSRQPAATDFRLG